jgi:hypothetical protein
MSSFQAQRAVELFAQKAVELFKEHLHECSIRNGRENASCDEIPRDQAAGGRGGGHWQVQRRQSCDSHGRFRVLLGAGDKEVRQVRKSAGPQVRKVRVPFFGKESVVKRAWIATLAALFVGMLALPATAAVAETTATEGFDAPFVVNDPFIGANGWQYNYGSARDVELVASGIGGGPSLRMSNAVTDGAFGDWVYSQRLNTPVTEDTDGNKFIAEFQFESETGTYQPGLQVSVSPQSEGGDRMSFLRFEDSNDGVGGIDVLFVDVQDDNGIDQRAVQIANNLSRAAPHDVKIVLDLYTGPHNDVAQVYIDGSGPLVPPAAGAFNGWFAPVDHPDTLNKLKAGQSVPMKWQIETAPATTWEDYYRNRDSETKEVDSLIFQARDNAGTAPLTEDHGFLFDNVKLSSEDTGSLPKTGAPIEASAYGNPIFSWREINCSNGDDIDPLETVDTPGASHLTYDAATGVWHYNWQTTNTMKNTCVKLTLNLTGDYALFKIVK